MQLVNMMDIIGIEALYIIATLLLASKDADTQLLKSKTDDALTLSRLNRWHKSGFFIASLVCTLCVLIHPELWWFMIPACVLIRSSLFDLGFNRWSSLDIRYIGNTAFTDRIIFRPLFGVNGAIVKSVVFFGLLIGFNVVFYGRL